MRDRRRFVDAQDLEAVEIVLLDAPVLEADLAIARKAQPHHRGAFDLRVDPFGVGRKAAIDRDIDARHQDALNRVWAEYFHDAKPATTTVQVVRLATDPRCLIEVNAIAVID